MKKLFKLNIRAYMMIIALVIIWVIFSIITGGNFLSSRNISNLFKQSVFTSILAIGMVSVIILGEIDLSVGSIVGLAGGITAIFDVWNGFNPIFTILITLAIGAAIGIWHGWWVNNGVPSFVVTLGGLLIYRGILIGITRGTTIGPLSSTFKTLGKDYLPNWFGIVLGVVASIFVVYSILNSRRNKKKYNFEVPSLGIDVLKILVFIGLITLFVYELNDYRGMPIAFLVLLFALLFFSYTTRNTVFGRSIYAIGGNKNAAKLSGINIKKSTLMVFMINGIMAALAGIILTSRLNAASVQSGDGAELDAIAACVIGGASLSGGIGTVSGAVIGAIVMASLDNGMSLMNMPMFWQSIIKGLVLIVAVWIDIATKKRAKMA